MDLWTNNCLHMGRAFPHEHTCFPQEGPMNSSCNRQNGGGHMWGGRRPIRRWWYVGVNGMTSDRHGMKCRKRKQTEGEAGR